MKKILTLCLIMLMWTSIAMAGININTASPSALEGINGVGPSKAAAIVKDREINGKFTSKQDLMRVKGIGPKLLEKIINDIEL